MTISFKITKHQKGCPEGQPFQFVKELWSAVELRQAFPLEGTPQGGLSCRCAAIHLQVAVALRLTDEGTARSAANIVILPFLPLTRTLISQLR